MFDRRFWLGLFASALFLGLLAWRVDLGGTVRALKEANYLFVVPGLGFYVVALVFRTVRWQIMLRPLRSVAFTRLFPVMVVGYMANNLLPVRLGELVRSYYVGQREDVSKSAALATIVVERVLDGVTLLLFLVVASVLLPGTGLVRDLASDAGVPLLVLVGAMTAPFVAVVALLVVLVRWPEWLLRQVSLGAGLLPGGGQARVTEMAALFVSGLAVLRDSRRLGSLLLLSLPVWLGEAAMYLVIGYGFGLTSPLGGIGVMAVAMLAVAATSNLALTLPASQGGIGPFEFFAAATLVVLGVQQEVAAAYAVVLHVALLVPVTLLGVVYLWAGKESLMRMVRIGAAGVGETAPTGLKSVAEETP